MHNDSIILLALQYNVVVSRVVPQNRGVVYLRHCIYDFPGYVIVLCPRLRGPWRASFWLWGWGSLAYPHNKCRSTIYNYVLA